MSNDDQDPIARLEGLIRELAHRPDGGGTLARISPRELATLLGLPDRVRDAEHRLEALAGRAGIDVATADAVASVARDLAAVATAFDDAIKGTAERVGIAGRVRSLEDWRERTTWFVRALLAAVVVLALKSLWPVLFGG